MPKVLQIIDGQVDFIEGGRLGVKGGTAALDRITHLINKAGHDLDDIVMTFDSHHPLHIAHPIWFMDDHGNPLNPLDVVKLEDYESENPKLVVGSLDDVGGFVPRGYCRTRHPGSAKWTADYIRALHEGGRYPHMIWPPHCMIGTKGAAAYEPLIDAVRKWEEDNFAVAVKVTKGSNIRVEHFSALKAEVLDPNDIDGTGVNTQFLKPLSDPNTTVYGCGLALSHCLANTVRDTGDQFDADSFFQRFVLLKDGTASVEGLEFLGESFVEEGVKRGMKVIDCSEF